MERFERDDGAVIIAAAERQNIFSRGKRQARAELVMRPELEMSYLAVVPTTFGYQVVHSDEAGYLLAECVKAHFRAPDLFYAETLADGRYLLVIVRDGDIVVDTIVEYSDFLQTAAGATVDGRFAVRASADAPVASGSVGDGLILQTDQVLSWEEVGEGFHLQVPLIRTATLVTLKEAFDRDLPSIPKTWLFASTSVAALAILAWVLWPQQRTEEQQVDPLAAAYEDWSQGVDFGQGCEAIARAAYRAHSIPGWQIESVELDGVSITATLIPQSQYAQIRTASHYLGVPLLPLAGTEKYVAKFPIPRGARSRDAFNRMIAMRPPHVESIVDALRASPWGFAPKVKAIQAGVGYREANVSVGGAFGEAVLRAAGSSMEGQMPNAAVRKIVYKPIEGHFEADILLYSNS